MHSYPEKIRPILLELDEIRPIHQPVMIEEHLVPLFLKHSGYHTILFYPIPPGALCGMHISDSETGVARIFYRRCSTHFPKELVASCPECQVSRVTMAKELVHVLDSEGARTSIDMAPDMLIDLLLKGALAENAQVHADSTAVFWAIEMLARFQHRLVQIGGALGPTSALQSAQSSDNWSLFAAGYAIPYPLAKIAYSANFMGLAKSMRESMGIPAFSVL